MNHPDDAISETSWHNWSANPRGWILTSLQFNVSHRIFQGFAIAQLELKGKLCSSYSTVLEYSLKGVGETFERTSVLDRVQREVPFSLSFRDHCWFGLWEMFTSATRHRISNNGEDIFLNSAGLFIQQPKHTLD
jgi:hypothetical protein